MTPKKGGYMAYAPALDLTTLFEVIFELKSSWRQSKIWAVGLKHLKGRKGGPGGRGGGGSS